MANYVGKYLDKSRIEEEDNMIEIVYQDEQNFCGVTANGIRIPFRDLDLKYERIAAPMYSPDVQKELLGLMDADMRKAAAKAKAARQAMQPSIQPVPQPIPQASPEPIVSTHRPTPQPTVPPVMQPTTENKTDFELFVDTAIKMSKKKNEKSSIPINIELKFDFDIFKIVGSCAELTEESDDKIINTVMQYSDISLDMVKKAIIEELLRPSKHEDEMNEELNKALNESM